MKITIVGTGYVGLISGVCLASKGNEVICVDTNPKIIQNLNIGIPHIYEKGLEELLNKVIGEGLFRATQDLNEALDISELAIVAVGTPSSNGTIDLRYIKETARNIGEYIRVKKKKISIIIKSTVIPGTTDTFVKNEIENLSGIKHPEFGLGMNPEFLREGNAIEDFMSPDRIVLGYEDLDTLHLLEKLYAPWNIDKVKVNCRTAEMIKYANNSMLALQISASNEIANLSACIGNIDSMEVFKAVHLDKRWNPINQNGFRTNPEILDYLVPGCGFGGSCFPKDIEALVALGDFEKNEMKVMKSVLDVNSTQPNQVIKIIEKDIINLKNKNALILGLAFKPNTDDVRESASTKIIKDLIDREVNIVAHDPIAINNFQNIYKDISKEIEFVKNWTDSIEKADIIIICTKWEEYLKLNKLKLSDKIIFDARRMLNINDLKNKSKYRSIGLRI
tara:strand:+ start:14089 stop:15435 length:1347 start_codon:yes stop_codon:yes gene_type:complete